MRQQLVSVVLVLATFLVLINNIHPIEAGRVLKEEHDDLLLLSSLQRGNDPPSSPNPTKPSSIDDRAFAGHAAPLPHLETNQPQDSFLA